MGKIKKKSTKIEGRERERERERDNLFCMRKYTQNEREWKIYSKMMEIRRVKIKEDKEAK